MDVEQSWKQQVDSQIIFEADFTWSYPFEKGKKYLIYLSENNERYRNSPCSPVEEAKASKDYEATLGEGFVPIKEVHLNHKMWFMTGKIFKYLLGFMILGGTILFIWGYLKRKVRK